MGQGTLVNTGIDTVKVNVKLLGPDGKPLQVQEVSQEFSDVLTYWQAQAQEAGEPYRTKLTFHDARLMMFPNGAPAWKYVLRNDCLEIKVCPRLELPMVAKVIFQSAYLWEMGNLQDAVDEVHSFLIDVFGEHLFLQAAQLDLCVDLVDLTLPTEWERVFITHALKKRPFVTSQIDQSVYGGRKLETIVFSGHGRPVSCKVYNKWTEIERKSPEKKWFYPLWRKRGWDGKAQVWRVEFSLERECLHEMDIEDIYDAIRNIKRMWAYCTQEWLRMVKPERDKNRTRWPTHVTWTLIQHAFDDYGCKMVDALGSLVREKKREANLDRAVAAIADYATTYAAWDKDLLSENDDAAAIFSVIYDRVIERWEKLQIVPQDEVRKKKFLYSQKG